MSETGATGILWSVIRQALSAHEDGTDESMARMDAKASVFADNAVERLGEDGYQITKAGAVTLSAEEAELGADGLSRLIARYESLANEHDRAGRTEQWLWERNNAAKFSALAAKLSGGAS